MAGVERTATRISGFSSPEMDFQLMRQLGACTSGGGAPGEIFSARARIAGGDAVAWPSAFAELAEMNEQLAETALQKGHDVTASGQLLRASSYYRSAEYFTDPFRPECRAFGLKSRQTFMRAAGYLPHRVDPVDIPFEGATLPGYFLTPAGGAADGRTVIAMTGFDGTGEELYLQTAVDGLARGFNVLIAEGPGQVGTLRRNPDMIFRSDYEAPIAAIVDSCLSRADVNADKLAIYGISFGGYFVLRGAAHDGRIRAVIANSPIIDLCAYMSGFVSEDDGEDVTLDEVDGIPDEVMPSMVKLSFKSSCRRFGVASFSQWLEALEAYRVGDGVGAISCPALAMVGAGEGEEAIGQFRAFCEEVSGPVTARSFTVQEGADMHCQLGNLPLSNSVVYDWLDEVFERR